MPINKVLQKIKNTLCILVIVNYNLKQQQNTSNKINIL